MASWRGALLAVAIIMIAPGAMAAAFEPIWARDGMVVTSVRPAAAAGAEVLRRGGNAADAAVATAFAAAVAHPFSSGLGGGMFAVTYTASGEATALDARELAPAGIDPEVYRKDQSKIKRGPLAVGVPGFVQGIHALHQRYGTLPWAELIEPAIDLAENGVQASVWHRMVVSRVHSRLAGYPETARIQLDNGEIPELGWTLVQKDLANTLRHIQKRGATALSHGEIARKIVQATDGAITEKDLQDYQVRWRDPIRGSYRGYQVVSMPPPSSGGVLLVAMLNMLESMDLKTMGHGSSQTIHMMTEVMRLAFADRAKHLGDPDHYPVPVQRLISEQYASERVRKIKPRSLVSIADIPQTPDDQGTTHISVMDAQGNAVAITQTINGIFGSLITVPETGIVLNNELDDFSIQPNTPNLWEAVGAEANAIVPGKRPLSSMTPTIVLKDDRPYMVMGSPMGTMIISSVLHALVNVVDHGMDPQDAVMAPRFHHQWKPDLLFHEPQMPVDVQEKLLSIGHKLNRRNSMGAVQIVQFDSQGCYFLGGVDGRRDSGAAAVNLDNSTGRRAACLAGATGR